MTEARKRLVLGRVKVLERAVKIIESIQKETEREYGTEKASQWYDCTIEHVEDLMTELCMEVEDDEINS